MGKVELEVMLPLSEQTPDANLRWPRTRLQAAKATFLKS